jgi:hypothetical protein
VDDQLPRRALISTRWWPSSPPLGPPWRSIRRNIRMNASPCSTIGRKPDCALGTGTAEVTSDSRAARADGVDHSRPGGLVLLL